MAIYQYTGTDRYGNNVRDIVEADSEKSARQKVKKKGVMLLSLSEKSIKKKGSFFGELFGE